MSVTFALSVKFLGFIHTILFSLVSTVLVSVCRSGDMSEEKKKSSNQEYFIVRLRF